MCRAYERRKEKGRRRIPEQAWAEIEGEIREYWSPEQISGRRRSGGQCTVSHERISKLLRMKKVTRKTSTLVAKAICNKLKHLTVHTLTSDNGTELSEHRQIAKTLKADFYFCHPYSSWERGLNENTNGLIRQFFPKHMNFDTITDEHINQVEDKLNNRPRKSLNYRTPNQVYFYEQQQLKPVALAT